MLYHFASGLYQVASKPEASGLYFICKLEYKEYIIDQVMQVLIFLALVFVVSVFILSPIEALFFSLSILALIIFGQMLVGVLIILVDRYFLNFSNKPAGPELDRYLSKNLQRSIYINRAIIFILVFVMSYIYSPLLVLPAIVGIVYWSVVEAMGESKFQLK